ncbi:hypothetical protein BCD49_19100 [Pseudofrankia sp. EUN1h]|nr:hypothetical protein BCD49_19100 [Pseudofrankia sp. EUN1h]
MASSFTATINRTSDRTSDRTSLDITGTYTAPSTASAGQTTIHTVASASATNGTALTESDSTVPTRPATAPALLASVDMGRLPTPMPGALTLTLTTAPTGCSPVTLATIVVVGITGPATSAPPIPSTTPSPPSG